MSNGSNNGLYLVDSFYIYPILELTNINISAKYDSVENLIMDKTAIEAFRSEELFKLVMRDANDGFWDWNLKTDEVFYSERWKRILGYEDHELENNRDTWLNLVHNDDLKIMEERARNHQLGIGQPVDIEIRMHHKDGHDVYMLSHTFLSEFDSNGKLTRLAGTTVDITERKKSKLFDTKHSKILEMIAIGQPAADIYNDIALMYEEQHPGMRCCMLELHGIQLFHGGAPSLPKEYCDALNGIEYGVDIGSCGTSTYTGQRVLVEDIATDFKWRNLKEIAMPHGMRSCWSQPIKGSSGRVLGAFGMYHDYPNLPNEKQSNDLTFAAQLAGIVMERDQAQKRIRQLAYTDELTGLPSRTSFSLHLEELIKASKQHNRHFCLLYLDLDNFKGVNDSLGHDVGDVLLKEIATRLSSIEYEIDFIARLSGDEFCILVNGGQHQAAIVASKCLTIVSRPIELAKRMLTPACSIGIALYPSDAKDPSTLLKASDTSLYAAKDQGKNQYVFYRTELTKKAEYRFQVEQYLREAIENQTLSLVYQPQLELKTNTVIGVEALCRWYHKDLGQVSPVDFITTAERIGVIKPLTEWVLYTACHQAIEWKKAGLPSIRISVNISPNHFIDREIVLLIKRVIDETGIEPTDLELEVTEGMVQTDKANLLIFQELKNIGVLLSIDDFGTGFSSFASLKHLEADCLKIDKYFIDDMLTDDKTKLLVSSMIDIGHKLGHGIIAEGVETKEQLQMLKELGCDAMQGYVFSKPVSADEISKLLKTSTTNICSH